METIKDILFNLDTSEIRKRLHSLENEEWEKVQELMEDAKELITTAAVYSVSPIASRTDETVNIDGTIFRSRILSHNLSESESVFPYVLTIGSRLEEKAKETNDVLDQYYLEIIGNAALASIRKHLVKHLRSRFGLEGLSYMSPGSLPEWPISEQIPLFSIIGGVENAINVRLNSSCLMVPKKSLSGIYFPTKVPFYSCQLCLQKTCPERQAPYDEEKARAYGISS